MKPWISTTDADPSPVCGRGDCDERASVVRYWGSESGKRWRSTSCEEHASERDPVSTMPGFRFLSEHAVHHGVEDSPPVSGPQDPSQVG